MKRLTIILLTLLLTAAMLIIPVSAAGESVTITPSLSGMPGETVVVTVSLSGFENVDGIGLSFEGLAANPDASSWLIPQESGEKFQLKDVTSRDAVYGSDIKKNISGAVLNLAFPIPADTTAASYSVIYTVVVNHGGGQYQATKETVISVKKPATAIALSASKVDLDVSATKSATVTATMTPADSTDTLTWTSSNTAVATVSNGVITAVKPGEATVTVSASSGVSAACQVTVTCSHASKTETAAKAASCTAPGNNKYYTCKACGTVLKADGKTATTVEAETLKKLDHSYANTWTSSETQHYKLCTGCGTDKDQVADHTFEWVEDTPATALENGKKHEECTVCKYKRNENTVIPHTHQVEEHKEVAATCSTTGTMAHFTCASTLCAGKKYSDASCTTEIADVTIPKNDNHVNTVEQNAKAPTCYQSGKEADVYCNDCKQTVKTGAVLQATGKHVAAKTWTKDESKHWHECTTAGCTAKLDEVKHTFVTVIDKPATEDETGLKHEECTCGATKNENTVIDKLPHEHKNIEHHPAVAATCKTTGYVEYWTCSSPKCAGKYYGDEACQEELTGSVVTPINPDNHTGGTELKNNFAANCYQDGYSGDTYCKGCNAVLEKGSVISATGNHVATGGWLTDSTHHWKKCATTGCTAEVDKAVHKYEWKVDEEATEDKTGLKHEECECGLKRNENTVIPKLDHVHTGIKRVAAVAATCTKEGTVEYWTCSSSKCSGKYYGDSKCQLELNTIVDPINPDNHVHTEIKDKVEATCAKAGYSGDTWCKDCQKMVKKGSEVAATRKHTPKAGYLKDEKYHWQECKVCNAVINNAKAEHTFSWVIDKKPTESAAGVKHEECTVCKQTRNEKTAIAKLVHAPKMVYAVDVTCTENGNIEYFYCGNCGRYFASEGGKQGKQITKEDTILEATGHSYSEEWMSDADNHWHECVCGEVEDKEVHTTELRGAVEATETAEGYTGDLVCTTCEKVLEAGESIPVLEAEPTEEPTEPSADVPTKTPANEETEQSGGGVLWIIPLVLGVMVVILVLIFKKRKNH